MVIKTDLCQFTEYRIYPGCGQKFVARDGKVSFFISSKVDSLFHQRIKPVKLRWTQAWRRMNKKGKVDEAAKKRTRKAQKFQKAIVGMSLDDIKKKKAQKPELRQAAREAEALSEERSAAEAALAELDRRLLATEPALEQARRRCGELEDALDEERLELGRGRREALLGEVQQHRDRLRALRRRGGALQERLRAAEWRIARGSFACRPEASEEPEPREEESVGQNLGYLQQWMDLEEARMGRTRPPPKPAPAPSFAKRRAHSSSPPRSAAALAALAAGANPAEAVALLDHDELAAAI